MSVHVVSESSSIFLYSIIALSSMFSREWSILLGWLLESSCVHCITPGGRLWSLHSRCAPPLPPLSAPGRATPGSARLGERNSQPQRPSQNYGQRSSHLGGTRRHCFIAGRGRRSAASTVCLLSLSRSVRETGDALYSPGGNGWAAGRYPGATRLSYWL